MLEVKNLVAGYGTIQILKGLNFRVESGEAVTMIGGNGAGKTTTLKSITVSEPYFTATRSFFSSSLSLALSVEVPRLAFILVDRP